MTYSLNADLVALGEACEALHCRDYRSFRSLGHFPENTVVLSCAVLDPD